MNKIYNLKREDWEDLLKRPTQTVSDIESTVNKIFTEVQGFGDSILLKYTQKFDGVALDALQVSESEIREASSSVSAELKIAIAAAKQNIEVFHSAQ